MKRSALRSLFLASLLEVVQCVVFGTHIYISERMNWFGARGFCREHYSDLSSINNEEEKEVFDRVSGEQLFPRAWIGLHKNGSHAWRWTDGREATYFDWAPRNQSEGDEDCVVRSQRGWRQANCETETLHFFCFRIDLILVEENKTWEEALEHCRLLDMDLASLLSDNATLKALHVTEVAQTDHVWTSLRYLGDSWFWVDRSIPAACVAYRAWGAWEAPKCPAWSHHCGAISVQGKSLDTWDCADRLNFLCSRLTQDCLIV